MKLYHGSSSRKIKAFNFRHSRKNLDFGKGIYFTTNFDQAKAWSCRNQSEGAVYECDIDLSQFNVLSYQEKEQNLLAILCLCRIGLEEIAPDAIDGYENTDVIWGRMLDGRMANFSDLAERFNGGEISYPEFEKQVELYEESYDQLCIKSKKALETVNASISKVYHTKKTKGKIDIVNQIDYGANETTLELDEDSLQRKKTLSNVVTLELVKG